jgi:hypothetical protein
MEERRADQNVAAVGQRFFAESEVSFVAYVGVVVGVRVPVCARVRACVSVCLSLSLCVCVHVHMTEKRLCMTD